MLSMKRTKPVKRAADLIGPAAANELARISKLVRHWVDVDMSDSDFFSARSLVDSWMTEAYHNAQEMVGMYGTSLWIADGPKIFRPTERQCAAMERLAVSLEVPDYFQPYPAVYVELPDCYMPFAGCVVAHEDSGPNSDLVICALWSDDGTCDIVTVVRHHEGRPIEESLRKFDPSLAPIANKSALALRVCVNACLALANFGHQAEAMFPADVANDKRLCRERSERGRRAAERIKAAPTLLRLDHEIVPAAADHRPRVQGEPTGREVDWHWRKAHKVRQPCGPGRTERREVKRRATLVRADKFFGELSDTTVTYRGR